MSANCRLYDELLQPVVEDYFNACRTAAELPVTDEPANGRQHAWLRARLTTLAEHGNRLARVLEVPAPLWADMRALAGMSLDH